MKSKKIMSSILALSIIAGSGYGVYNVLGKSMLGNMLSLNVVYAKGSEDVAIKDLKEKAMKIIKNHFEETPNFKQLKFSSEIYTKEDRIKNIDKTINFKENVSRDELAALESAHADMIAMLKKHSNKEDIKTLNQLETIKKQLEEERVKRLEEVKKNIKYGTINMSWQSKDEVFGVIFDDKTKEVLKAYYESKGDKINSKNFISVADAKKIAEKFLAEKNIASIKTKKLVKKEEFQSFMKNINDGFDYDSVAFFYEDANNKNKKANIVVNRITGEITEFAVGKATEGITYKTSPN